MMDRHLASIMLSLAILVLLFMFDASSGANTDETNRANVAEEGTDDLAADRAACIKEVATELKPLDKLYILPDAQVMKRLDEARRYYEVEGEISLGPEELKSCVELRGQFQKVLDGQGECFKGINPLSPKWIVPAILQEADEQTKLRFEALYACEWGRFTGPSIEPDIYEAIVGSRRVEADDDDDEFFETKSRFDDESDSDDEEYHESDDLFGDEVDFNDDNDDDDDVFHESKRHFEDEADSDGEEKFLEVKDYLDADIIKSDNDYEDQIKTSKCFEKVLPLIKSEIQIDDPTLMERVEDAQKHYAYAREDIPHYGGEQLDACVRLKVRLNEIFISTDCLNDNNLIGIPIEVKFREIASVDENARHVLETFYACQEGRYAGHKLRDLKLFDVITAPLRGAQ